MKRAFLPVILALAGCGEAVKDDHFSADVNSEAEASAPVTPGTLPVRVGELGANFAACGSAATRHLPADGQLTVRAAPDEDAAETGTIAGGARFFVCTRSIDQRWMGVVYDADGALSPACGVSSPIASRRAYDGPCRSGWVSSAFVKLIAGESTLPPRAPSA